VIFGEFALEEAQGTLLAHTTRLRGGVLPKGVTLDPAAIAALRRTGVTHVTAARLEPDDIGEDEAASRLADALLAPGVERTRTGTGRANLAAAHHGLFRVEAAALDALNAIHEGLTIGTLPDAAPVRAGDLLVTVKIIPFSLPGAVVRQAEALAHARPPLRLPAFRPLRTGLIVTTLPGVKDSVYASTIAATEARILSLTGSLLPPVRVPHDRTAIAGALRTLIDQGAQLLLVAGASAAVDRGDVAPAAITALGGVIAHFGMPVDPGNLMCIGQVAGIPALVLPGCARSPSLNGIDFVLARLFAGETADGAEIARLGVGGLLKSFAARPAPRSLKPAALAEGAPQAGPPSRAVAALVLAAGLSRRMGPDNKLLIQDRAGRAMVAHVTAAAQLSRAQATFVVLGHEAERVAEALSSYNVTFVKAEAYETGLAASLRAGIAALPETVQAVIVCLGDMPLVTSAMLNALIAAYDPGEGRLIVVPTHRGKRGNPVLWDRRFFPEILALTGDTGARSLLLRHAESVAEVDIGDSAVLVDFDTAEGLDAFRGKEEGRLGEQCLPPQTPQTPRLI
jgi:molybdenum cofactor cytidylyltransferase